MGLFDRFRKSSGGAAPPPEPPVVTAEAATAAHAVADHLWLMFGDGARVQLLFERVDGFLRLQSANVSPGERDPPEIFADDRALRSALLAHDVDRLVALLGRAYGGWEVFSASFDGRALALFGAEIAIDEGLLLHGRAFLERLGTIAARVQARQADLQRAMSAPGPCQVSWERDAGLLQLTAQDGARISIPADVLGSYDPSVQSWCWAWSNRSFTAPQVQAAASLRPGASVPGLRILGAPGLPCTAPFAFMIAYLAADILGERAVWRWPLASGVQLFFAIAPEAIGERRSG